MAYCTLEDMLARFDGAELVQLTDDIGTGEVDAGKAEIAIADAGSLIDAAIAARHTLPLTAVPDWLRRVACDLAMFNLWKTSPPERVAKARDEAMKMLDRVATGKLRLDQGVEAETARPGAVLIADPGRTFSRDRLRGF